MQAPPNEFCHQSISTSHKVVLVIVVVASFLPITLMLLFAIIILTPGLVQASFLAPEVLWIYAVLVGGILGLIGLVALLKKLLKPQSGSLSARLILIYMVLGLLALGSMMYQEGIRWNGIWFATAVMPVITSLWLCFLGRDYLFGRQHEEPDSSVD